MNSIDLIKKTFVEATNAYAVARGIAKPFDDPQHCPSPGKYIGQDQEGLDDAALFRCIGLQNAAEILADAQRQQAKEIPILPACNTEAIEAYKLNVDADANAWKLLEEIGRKAELAPELVACLKEFCILIGTGIIKCNSSDSDAVEMVAERTMRIVKKYEALPK